VFKTFIQVAKELAGGVLQDNIQRDWLLFQILPFVRINDRDPFSALISLALSGMQFDVLQRLRSQLGPEAVLAPVAVLGSSFNFTTDSFFYVIDEAQVAGERYMGAFRDPVGNEKWPVLHPIIRHMMRDNFNIKVIISGTRFSLELLRTLVKPSGVAKPSLMFDIIHTTGDFSEPDTQSLYISRYLPPSFLASDSGTRLKTRIYDWLRGRYVGTKISRR